MRNLAWSCVAIAGIGVACSAGKAAPSNGGSAGSSGSGASAGQAGGVSGASGSGAAGATGGQAGSGVSGSGTAGTGVSGSAGAGASGAAGSSGASGSAGASGSSGSSGAAGAAGSAGGSAWQCPASSPAPTLGGTATRVAGVPPMDAFNMNDGFGNIEGPVWIGDALYVSEISNKPNPPPSRILKITATDQVSIVGVSGTNGLATNAAGELLGARHADGSVSKFSLTDASVTQVLAAKYANMRFNSPNDLAVRSDGTVYFSDPDFQSPKPDPQATQSLYRVPPGGQPVQETAVTSQPNGVTLSPDEKTLYVSGSQQLRKFPINTDGSLGAGSNFLQSGQGSGDGMVVDCGGNLYVANVNGSADITVYSPAGMQIGTIIVGTGGDRLQSTTNVAFGGMDHKTLYITGLGNTRGLFKITMNVAGMPY